MPEKNEPWQCILNAFEFENDCIQLSNPLEKTFGSEDCLHLNVYVPVACSAMNPKANLSVMVYIFGGFHIGGSSKYYGPEYLMDENIILVFDISILLKCIFFSIYNRFILGNFEL